MPYPTFDRSQLRLLPLAERVHDFHVREVLPLDADLRLNDGPEIHAALRWRQAGLAYRPRRRLPLQVDQLDEHLVGGGELLF